MIDEISELKTQKLLDILFLGLDMFGFKKAREAWLDQEYAAAVNEKQRLLKYTFQDNEHWQMYNAARDRCDHIANMCREFYQAQEKQG